MKNKILYLTNVKNGSPEEDEYLIGVLKNDFELIVCHPLECKKYLSSVMGIVIRNIWPTHEYFREWEEIKKMINDSGLPTYNPLIGKGDNRGKDYLVNLYGQNFPVIPSVDRVGDIDKLPASQFYWIKPKKGSDGFGAKKLTKKELLSENPKDYTDYIIQPFEEFLYEPSFFFIDNVFSYAISMPNRLADINIVMYSPTPQDILFAEQFVKWENLPYGIQRIDAVRTKDGRLLLTEDEDIADYLYLLDIDATARERVTKELIRSIKAVMR